MVMVKERESGCSEAKDQCAREKSMEQQNGNLFVPSLCLYERLSSLTQLTYCTTIVIG